MWTEVLVLNFNEVNLDKLNKIAREIRQKNIVCEIFPEKKALNKQLKYASKRNINFVIFVEENGEIYMKNMLTKEQSVYDICQIKEAL